MKGKAASLSVFRYHQKGHTNGYAGLTIEALKELRLSVGFERGDKLSVVRVPLGGRKSEEGMAVLVSLHKHIAVVRDVLDDIVEAAYKLGYTNAMNEKK